MSTSPHDDDDTPSVNHRAALQQPSDPSAAEVAASLSTRDLERRALGLLTPQERRNYRIGVILQMLTSFLDLAGVVLIGLVAVIATSLATGSALPATVQTVIDVLGLSQMSLGAVSILVGVVAAVLLIIKPVIVLFISRKVTNYLAHCAARVSNRVAAEFFALPIVRVNHFTGQFTSVALSRATNLAIVNVLSNRMVVRVELALIVTLSATLLLIDPITTIFAVIFLGLAALAMTRGLSGWARRTGEVSTQTDIDSLMTVQDGIATYREVTVANRRLYYIGRFERLRGKGARAFADQQFIALIPRYIMEVVLVLGAALLVIALVTAKDPETAVGGLTLFLTAASRIMPSMLRMNSARISTHALRGIAGFAFILIDFVDEFSPARQDLAASPQAGYRTSDRSPPRIEVRGTSVCYPGSQSHALQEIDLNVLPGQRVALVGPSGAGKSTLADVILGVMPTDSGKVLIDGQAPRVYIAAHPGAIAYVPQDVALVSGTVRDNVALGLPPDEVDDDQVWSVLGKARLADFLRENRDGLDTLVGDRGVRLSGGQRQRLGIARALYSEPSLLVLDEATSALDSETEHAVSQTLNELGRDVTTVTVAHRLATIRQADAVVYLEGGRIRAMGTFDEVRSAIPRFDRQAQLLGL